MRDPVLNLSTSKIIYPPPVPSFPWTRYLFALAVFSPLILGSYIIAATICDRRTPTSFVVKQFFTGAIRLSFLLAVFEICLFTTFIRAIVPSAFYTTVRLLFDYGVVGDNMAPQTPASVQAILRDFLSNFLTVRLSSTPALLSYVPVVPVLTILFLFARVSLEELGKWLTARAFHKLHEFTVSPVTARSILASAAATALGLSFTIIAAVCVALSAADLFVPGHIVATMVGRAVLTFPLHIIAQLNVASAAAREIVFKEQRTGRVSIVEEAYGKVVMARGLFAVYWLVSTLAIATGWTSAKGVAAVLVADALVVGTCSYTTWRKCKAVLELERSAVRGKNQ